MPRKPSKILPLEVSMQHKDTAEAMNAVADEMIAWIKGRIDGNNQLPISNLKRADMLNLAFAAIARWVTVRSAQEAAELNDPIDDLWRPHEKTELAQMLG